MVGERLGLDLDEDANEFIEDDDSEIGEEQGVGGRNSSPSAPLDEMSAAGVKSAPVSLMAHTTAPESDIVLGDIPPSPVSAEPTAPTTKLQLATHQSSNPSVLSRASSYDLSSELSRVETRSTSSLNNVKRKRGRPRKYPLPDPNEPPKPKRGRGRPKKQLESFATDASVTGIRGQDGIPPSSGGDVKDANMDYYPVLADPLPTEASMLETDTRSPRELPLDAYVKATLQLDESETKTLGIDIDVAMEDPEDTNNHSNMNVPTTSPLPIILQANQAGKANVTALHLHSLFQDSDHVLLQEYFLLHVIVRVLDVSAAT